MIKKLAVAVIIITIATLSIAGCTSSGPSTDGPFTSPAQEMNPRPDYSSWYNGDKMIEQDTGQYMTVEKPFTRSTNVRGNDVYMAVISDSKGNNPSNSSYELAKTKAEGLQIFNKTVADKQKAGFTDISGRKPNPSDLASWGGDLGSQRFYIYYHYDPSVSSWELHTVEYANFVRR